MNRTMAELEQRIHTIENCHAPHPHGPKAAASDLLAIGENVLEHWVSARDQWPTAATKEGFRLLALHAQGARGAPSFNACRETARELAYHYNLVDADPSHVDATKRLKMMGLVAKHLLLFVSGKMDVEGLGEFCCAAKPIRALE